jgi:hypothetical protein
MKKSLTLRLLVCIALIVVSNNLCAQREMINKQIPNLEIISARWKMDLSMNLPKSTS